jgi:hypothetical protein
MTVSNALTTPPIQQPVAPQPAAPARIGPGGFAAPVKAGNAVPPETVPTAPFESQQTLQIPPEEHAKALVDAFHAVRAELRALEKHPEDAGRIHAKQLQLTVVQNWAIEAATVNEVKQKRAADILEKELTDAKSNVAVAAFNYDNATSAADKAKYLLIMTTAQQAEIAAENPAMQGRQNLAEAGSLLEQALGSRKGNLDAAHDNQRRALVDYVAADMKLKGASKQPHPNKEIIDAATKEFKGAARQLVDAELESVLAAKPVTNTKSQPAP